MRQIIFDTETTGMNFNAQDKSEGHRIIELGCVELIDRQPTGNNLHLHFNPEQDVDEGAVRVHGMDNAFLADKPLFADCLDEIEAYLAGADELIAHNMGFDESFINRELRLAGRNYTLGERFTLVDTVPLAKKVFPNQRVSLDHLCRYYSIDNSNRTKHGALLDSELLLEVYLRLTGGQKNLFAGAEPQQDAQSKPAAPAAAASASPAGTWIKSALSEEEIAAHNAILEKIRG